MLSSSNVVRIDGTHSPFTIIQDTGAGGHVLLASTDDGNLRCTARGSLDNAGGRGPWARWIPTATATPGVYLFKNFGHHDAGRDVYLSIGEGGGVLTTSSKPTNIKLVQLETSPPPPAYALDAALRDEFIARGHIRLPAFVSDQLVAEALRTINATLGLGAAAWVRSGQLIRAARAAPSVLALLYGSGLYGVAQALLGNVTTPKMAQLALRFPNERKEPPEEQWHIDGMKKHHLSPFNLLVGVALSAQPAQDMGNLAVWPGCHVVVHEAVGRARARQGEDAMAVEVAGDGSVQQATAAVEEADEDEDTEEDGDAWRGERPVLGPNACAQLLLEPGDAVLLHQRLPHRVSPNHSPHVRYMVRSHSRLHMRTHSALANKSKGTLTRASHFTFGACVPLDRRRTFGFRTSSIDQMHR